MSLKLTKKKSAFVVSAGSQIVTYYVDPAGSDSNDGLSKDRPWQTISKVNGATIPAGARVLFKGGSTFSGQLTLVEGKHFGTAGKTIVFGSYGVGRATIQASTNSDEGIYAVNPHHLSIRDLNFVGTGTTVSTGSGIHYINDLLSNSKLLGISLIRLEVSGYGVDGIALYCGDNAYAASSSSGFTSPIIDSCVVHDCTGNCVDYTGNGITLQGFYGSGAAASHINPVVRNCRVYNCTGKAGITVSHSGNGILLGQCIGGLVEYCEAYNNGANNTYASGPVGIWMYDSTYCVIQFCESHHNKTGSGTSDGGGFDIDGGCQNCTVQYCYSHDNYGSGYLMYQYNDAGMRALTSNTVRYNISENDGTQDPATKAAIMVGTEESTRAAPGNAFYGNTIYTTVASSNGVFILNNPDQFTTGYFCNNIFYVTGTSSKLINSSTNTTPAFRFVGNLYQATSVGIKWGTTVYSTIASWRAAFTTQETVAAANTSVSGDPLFAATVPLGNINGFDPNKLIAYKTQSGSPARNAGKDILSLFSINMGTRDLYGGSIPQGSTYDIGCFEGT